MKCQILFSGKNKENAINLLSTEFVQRVVTVNYRKLSFYKKANTCYTILKASMNLIYIVTL